MSSYHQHERWPGLLSAILTSGKDDLPRLVAADHIEECGDEWRADYIRKMIADKIGRIEYGGWDSGNPFGYDFGFQEQPDRRLVLVAHRGFICEVRGLLEDVMTALPELVRKECVERVVVTDREPDMVHDFGTTPRWWDTEGGPAASCLPTALFEKLDGRDEYVGPWTFRCGDAAAMSAAAITWAKGQPFSRA